MPFISAENLIQGYPNIQPETVNLIRWFYSQFNNRSAANRTIVNVEPLFYEGVIAGTEFLTYGATKLYICFSFETSVLSAVGNNTFYIQFYNESNIAFNQIENMSIVWNVTGAAYAYLGNNYNIKNLYFSRITNLLYTSMIFNGYRITLS